MRWRLLANLCRYDDGSLAILRCVSPTKPALLVVRRRRKVNFYPCLEKQSYEDTGNL
jgi:hypothetical protein